jgi:hypothetical protein
MKMLRTLKEVLCFLLSLLHLSEMILSILLILKLIRIGDRLEELRRKLVIKLLLRLGELEELLPEFQEWVVQEREDVLKEPMVTCAEEDTCSSP